MTFLGHELKNVKKVFSLFLGSPCRETPKTAIKKNKKEKYTYVRTFLGGCGKYTSLPRYFFSRRPRLAAPRLFFSSASEVVYCVCCVSVFNLLSAVIIYNPPAIDSIWTTYRSWLRSPHRRAGLGAEFCICQFPVASAGYARDLKRCHKPHPIRAVTATALQFSVRPGTSRLSQALRKPGARRKRAYIDSDDPPQSHSGVCVRVVGQGWSPRSWLSPQRSCSVAARCSVA